MGRGRSGSRGWLERPGEDGRGEAEEDRTEETFHHFYDKANGTHTYEGDGHHQVDWFNKNSNYDEIIRSANDNDEKAMRAWARGYFMEGDQYGGWDSMNSMAKGFTQRYDDMLDRSVVAKGVRVVRRTTAELLFGAGHKTASLEELQAMEGRIITSKANLSAGAASQGLTIGATDKKHEFRIHIPGGSTGAGMWIGDSRINGWGAKQREFMMNRDIDLRVGKSYYDKARDVYVTDVRYVGRLEHDYGKSGRLP
ncbi:MAG: hypothetical protein IJW67_13545 [Blautia sp.]|nr:hypothetical protein [Blautia sp.]